MRSFVADTVNEKTGKKQKSSVFLTFRVMHQDSRGWIVPAKPGLKIAESVAQQMEQEGGQFLQELLDRL